MEGKITLEEMAKLEFGQSITNKWEEVDEEKVKLDALSRSKKLFGEVDYMVYDPSYIGEDSNDFMRVDTKKRLNLLKLYYEEKKNKKKSNEEQDQEGNQVITINTNYKVSKKRAKFNAKNKASKESEQKFTKFESIAQIKSEWVEIKKIDFDERKNNNIKVETNNLKEETQEERQFNLSYVSASVNNPIKLSDVKQDVGMPHHILEDKYLMDLFENEKVSKNKIGLFMSENVLYILSNIRKTQFPFILKAKKQNNKFLIYFDISPNNCFTFLESYRENNLENYFEDESKVQEFSVDSTKIMETFQLETISNNKFDKMKNYRYIKVSLDSDVEIYTRVSLEGQNKKNNEILVRALYDIPSLFLKKNNSSNIYQDCVQHNMSRISKWLSHCYFAGKIIIYKILKRYILDI